MYSRPGVQFRILETRSCRDNRFRRWVCEQEEGAANLNDIAFLKQDFSNGHAVYEGAVGAIEIGYPAFSVVIHGYDGVTSRHTRIPNHDIAGNIPSNGR